jgi:hypothetical protein
VARLTPKQLAKLSDAMITRAFYKHSAGVLISVMDIPKLFDACRPIALDAIAAGDVHDGENRALDAAMLSAIETYRCKPEASRAR